MACEKHIPGCNVCYDGGGSSVEYNISQPEYRHGFFYSPTNAEVFQNVIYRKGGGSDYHSSAMSFDDSPEIYVRNFTPPDNSGFSFNTKELENGKKDIDKNPLPFNRKSIEIDKNHILSISKAKGNLNNNNFVELIYKDVNKKKVFEEIHNAITKIKRVNR